MFPNFRHSCAAFAIFATLLCHIFYNTDKATLAATAANTEYFLLF